MTVLMIWDGVEFIDVSEAEARALVKAGKAIIMQEHDGSALPVREEMSGYQNKAMATEVKATPKRPARPKQSKAKP